MKNAVRSDAPDGGPAAIRADDPDLVAAAEEASQRACRAQVDATHVACRRPGVRDSPGGAGRMGAAESGGKSNLRVAFGQTIQ